MKGFWEKGVAFRTGVPGRQVLFLACCYLSGALLGYFVSFFSDVPTVLLEAPQWSAFWRLFWYYAKGLVVAFVCSYTALGLLVQPALLAVRGYLTCTVISSIVMSFSQQNAREILAGNALISLVSLLCLFFMCMVGLQNAKAAFSVVTRRRIGRTEPGIALRPVLFFFSSLLLIAAAGVVNILLASRLADLLSRIF